MTCANCEVMREELEAWKAYARPANLVADERFATWRSAFPGAGYGGILVLMRLVDDPSLLTREALIRLTRQAPNAIPADEVTPEVAGMAVWRIRRSLKALSRSGRLPASFKAGGIENLWGQGWRMDRTNAAALKIFVGETQ